MRSSPVLFRELVSRQSIRKGVKTRNGMQGTQGHRAERLVAFSSSEVRQKFDRAAHVFETGNRMETLKIYETALKSEVLTLRERQEALYGSTAVHASFGDVEQAQMSLREGLACGLDFEAALKDEDLLKWRSGPQVLVQLKKFAKAMTSIKKAVDKPPSRPQSSPASTGRLHLSDSLKTDFTGIDTSITGIVRRVAILLAVGLLAGGALFYVGLEFSGISH